MQSAEYVRITKKYTLINLKTRENIYSLKHIQEHMLCADFTYKFVFMLTYSFNVIRRIMWKLSPGLS